MARERRNEAAAAPRLYRLGLRQAAVDEKRGKIVEAARSLIMSERALAGFSVEAVAREAGVARATVYNQFGNRAGLLEALFDDLARRGGMFELKEVFRVEEPLDALKEFVRAFGHFWTGDRLLIRRLHGMNALDAEMARADAARNERRRGGLQKIVQGVAARYGLPAGMSSRAAVEVLQAVTSFEFFDQLAGETRTPAEVVPVAQKLAVKWLGLDGVKI